MHNLNSKMFNLNSLRHSGLQEMNGQQKPKHIHISLVHEVHISETGYSFDRFLNFIKRYHLTINFKQIRKSRIFKDNDAMM